MGPKAFQRKLQQLTAQSSLNDIEKYLSHLPKRAQHNQKQQFEECIKRLKEKIDGPTS